MLGEVSRQALAETFTIIGFSSSFPFPFPLFAVRRELLLALNVAFVYVCVCVLYKDENTHTNKHFDGDDELPIEKCSSLISGKSVLSAATLVNCVAVLITSI